MISICRLKSQKEKVFWRLMAFKLLPEKSSLVKSCHKINICTRSYKRARKYRESDYIQTKLFNLNSCDSAH